MNERRVDGIVHLRSDVGQYNRDLSALRTIFRQGAGVKMIWPLILIACVMLPLTGWLFRHRSQ